MKEPRLPSQIDRYEIIQTLGQGGMATVYLALDPNLERPVAIKVINIEKEKQQGLMAKRLLQEARLMAGLEHPHIVRVYDRGYDTSQKLIWMAMEQVKGVSIDQWQKTKKPGKRQLLDVISQIGEALAFAHAKGVIHRDIKPSNILIDTRDGKYSVKLADFGIAQIYEKISRESPVQSAGTWPYMSPEQKGDGKITTKSDVYMLARVFLELLTGTTTPDIPTKLLGKPDISLPDFVLPVQSEVRAVLSDALKANPKQRTSDVMTLVEDLATALEPLDYQDGSFIFDVPKHNVPKKDIYILQMTDLEIRANQTTASLSDEIKLESPNAIQAMIICGNIAFQANEVAVYDRAERDILNFSKKIGVSPLIAPAPGPRDVNLTLTKESLADRWENVCEKPPHIPPETDLGFNRNLYRQKMAGFAKIFEELTNQEWTKEWKRQYSFLEIVPPERNFSGIVTIILNSAYLVHHLQPDHEALDESILASLHITLAKRYPDPEWIRILVFHLDSLMHQNSAFKSDLTALFGEVDLVLHGGHKINEKDLFYYNYNTLIIPVPSLIGKRNNVAQSNYNLLKIDRQTKQLSIMPVRNGVTLGNKNLGLKPVKHPHESYHKIPVRHIPREVQVSRFQHLETILNVIEKRKFCFLIGGQNSGRKTFLLQFEEYSKQLQSKFSFHILSFNYGTYQSYLETLRFLATEEDFFVPQAELNSLFASLAWSAFQLIKPNNVFFRDWPKNQIKELTEKSFLLLYVSERGLLAVQEPMECLTFFLNFLRDLNELALEQEGCRSMAQRLAVFMPFEEFERLFRRNQDRVMKKLWGALCVFARGFENPSSDMQRLTHDIAVLISLPCVTLGIDAAQGHFLKSSVLQIPPMDKEEIIEFGQAVCDSVLDDEVLASIMRHSGGLPWFVKLLLICLGAVRGRGKKAPDLWVPRAIDHAKAIVRLDFSGLKPGQGLDGLSNEVTQYYQILDKNLKTLNSFEDPQIYQAWKEGTRINSSGRITDWIATGLVFPRNKHKDKDPIFIFDSYPHIWFRAAAPLPLYLFESWKKSRTSIGDTE